MARPKKKQPSMVRVREGIYRRPNGKYVVPIYDPRTGKKKLAMPGVPKGGFDTIKEAQAFKRRVEEDKHRQGFDDETCDAFAKRWPIDYPRKAITTNAHNAERIKAFARDFKGIPLSGVTRPMARLWVFGGAAAPALADVASGWKGAKTERGKVTVPNHRPHYKTVRAMFNDAVGDYDHLRSNPFAALKVPEEAGRENILVLTEEEIQGLVKAAADQWGDYGELYFGPMMLVAAYTGMRPGELYALRWSAIDLERDELHITKALQSKTGSLTAPKGGEPRTVTLLPQARAALQRVPKRLDDDHVFFTQSGKPFTQRAHHYYWSPVRSLFWGRLADKDGQRAEEIPKDFDWYELRHFYGTHLAIHWNASPYEIADQMGHKDGGTLAAKRYIHPVSRDVRASLRRRIQDREMGVEATG